MAENAAWASSPVSNPRSALPPCPALQACVDLPAVDCDPENLADCYKGAATCADYFWTLCFDKSVLSAGEGIAGVLFCSHGPD